MTRRFKPPVYAVTKRSSRHWIINIEPDERAVVIRLLGELRDLLMSEDESDSPLLTRLFPPAFIDDEEKEEEYQRLMRRDLVTSRLVQIDAVTTYLAPDGPEHLAEGQVIAFMQSINAVRVVLGTLLDVGEDDEITDDDAPMPSPEHQLYGYLSWLLDWTVRSLSDA